MSVDQVGDYKLIKRLSQGTSGVVYLVEKDGAKLALKHLKDSDASAIVRFRRESSTLARLKNKSLPKIHDVGEFDGAPYMVMDLLEGETLESLLAKNPTGLPFKDVTMLARSIASALAEVHKNDLVHRDLKPANIMVLSTGEFKLIDFGLVGDVKTIVSETALVGTPLYCSPEQSKVLKRPVDARSDLYSLGVTLFECVTGQPPFKGSLTEILQQHSSKVAADVRDTRADASAPLSKLIAKLLSKDPDDRYLTSNSLVFDLDQLADLEDLAAQGKEFLLGGKYRTNFSTTTAFVERREDRARLNAIWKLVEANTAGFAIVSGPSGSGKSRFCEEFAQSKAKDNFLVLKGKCQFFDKAVPFGPIREAIESFIETSLSLPVQERDKLNEQILSACAGHERTLSDFSKGLKRLIKFEGDHKASVVSDENAQDVYFRDLAGFFGKLSDSWNGVVLFIDDLQWMDTTSIQALKAIVEDIAGKKFLVLGTARNDESSRNALADLGTSFQGSILGELKLAPFAINEIYSLVSGFLGTNDVHRQVIDSIKNKSAGNPLVATDLLRAYIEGGALVFKDDKWHLVESELAKLDFSEDVYAVILERLTEASVATSDYLRAAACYGNVFCDRDIAEVVGLAPEALSGVLESAETLGLIQRAGENRYQFVHNRIVEALVNSQTDEARAQVSKKLFDHLYRDDLGELPAEAEMDVLLLARLCEAAGNLILIERAARITAAAGDLALRNFAYSEAYGFYKRANVLIEKSEPDGNQRIHVTSKLAHCASLLGHWKEASELSNYCIRESRTKKQFVDSLRRRVWLEHRSGETLLSWEYFKLARAEVFGPYPRYFLERSLSLIAYAFMALVFEFLFGPWLIKRGGPRQRSQVTTEVVDLHYYAYAGLKTRGELLDALLVSFMQLNFCFRHLDAHGVALAYSMLGYCISRIGFLKHFAIAYATKGIRLAGELNNPYLLAQCKALGETTLFFADGVLDFDKVTPRDVNFFRKYLDPTAKSALWDFWQQQMIMYGMSKKSLTLIEEQTRELEQNGFAAARHETLNVQVFKWNSLSFQGKAQAAQKTMEQALELANEFRWVPTHRLRPMRTELSIRRFTGETDTLFHEMIERRTTVEVRSLDQWRMTMSVPWLYLVLRKLELTLNHPTPDQEELLRLRHEFCEVWLASDPRIISSGLLSIHYHQLGRYYRLLGKHSRALQFLEKSERLATKHAIPIAMFDAHFDIALIWRERGYGRNCETSLLSAYKVAREQEWKPKLDELNKIFAKELETLLPELAVSTNGVPNATGAVEGTTHARSKRSSVQSNHTRQATSATFQKPSNATQVQSSMDEVRFVDALMKVSVAFVSSSDLKEQSKLVLTEVVKLFAAQRGFVFLKMQENEDLSIIAGKDDDGSDLEQLTGFSGTVVNKAFSTGTPVIVTGTEEGEALGSESAILNNLRSIMATPLKVKDAVVGVVYLDSSLTKGLFTQDDIELFSTLANHIAVSFELSRMAKVELEKANLKRELDVQSAIAVESKKVEVLVDNMQQAVFAIDKAGTIVSPVSRHTEKTLGCLVEGKNVLDVLYKDNKLEERDRVKSTMNAVFGEGDIQWDLASDGFVRKVFLRTGTGEPAVLKILPSPVWDEESLLEKVLFVVEDVTALEQLENRVREQQESAILLNEILSSDLASLKEFFSRTEKAMQRLDELVLSVAAADGPESLEFLRDLHTLKGNSRLFKLQKLSEQIHESESQLAAVRSSAGSDDITQLRDQMTQELKKIAIAFQAYLQVFARIQSSGSSLQAETMNEHAYARLESFVKNPATGLSNAEFRNLRKLVSQLKHSSLNALAVRFAPMVSDISRQLSKQVEFKVDGTVPVDPRHIDVLQDCFLHLIRNSLDHGLEGPDERLKANKPASGTLTISCKEDEAGTRIQISDDGRGVNPDVVSRKAVEKGIVTQLQAAKMSDTEKVNLIFAPNFSTRSEANDLSGRGLGLDIVKSALENIGGNVEVTSRPGQGTTFEIFLQQTKEIGGELKTSA